ncbi:MAG: NAD(P)/FAD-dependent oxidoreductase [Bacteroidota bacterium]
MKNITIVGSGLVGSLLAIYLAKKGHKVSVYERRVDLRKNRISAGKSINLALSDRGWKALEGIGIDEEIRKVAIPMKGRRIHNLNGDVNFQPYGKEGQAIYSVSRGGLNCKLMDLAEHWDNVEFFFEERCTNVDMENATAHFENTSTGKKSFVESDLIFGSDGAFSAGRLSMQMTDKFEYSQHYLEHGYKELLIPANEDGSFKMDSNALHIWPRGSYMLIALPNLDGTFTCTLFFPFEGENSFASINTESELMEFFNRIFPDVVPLMPTLVHDYFTNPTSSLVTVKCFPWTYKDKVALIGDAAHAIVPFFGQGMNCGFEDCTILNELMEENGDDWTKILKAYELARKPNSDAIAELAISNFIEMRDLVADHKFLLRKKIEAYLNEQFSEKWMPLYSMVTFSQIPYSEAMKEGKRQEQIMQKIMAMDNLEERWNNGDLKSLLPQLIS